MSAIVRPAVEDDRRAIRSLVWQARLYPLRLCWKHFFVAEDDGRIVAAGQIRHHRDGTHELASLVVAPDHRGRGLAGALIARLLDRDSEDIYLCCRAELEGFYVRHSFYRVQVSALPASMARLYRLEDFATRLLNVIRRPRRRLIVLKHVASREVKH